MAGKKVMTAEEREALLKSVDWAAIDATTDDDIARQIAEDHDVAPDLSDAPPSSLTVRHPPGAVNVRAIRAKFDLTQNEFAARFGFALGTLRDWEQGRATPEGPARTLLLIIDQHPDVVEDVLRQANAA